MVCCACSARLPQARFVSQVHIVHRVFTACIFVLSCRIFPRLFVMQKFRYDKSWSDPYQNVSFLPFVNMIRNEAWPADSLLDFYDTFIRSAIQATPFKFQFDYPFTVLMAKWPKVNPLALQRQAPPTAYYFQVCAAWLCCTPLNLSSQQNVLAMSGSASPTMTESSFSRFTSQVTSNLNYGGTPYTIFPVIVQGAGEHVFFLASDCMAAFVDPTTAIANTVPNPSTCATQVLPPRPSSCVELS